MLKIRTVCGNGIGSSLMCAGIIREILAENNLQADVESVDFSSAAAQKADLYVTVKELADQFPENVKVVTIRSYVSKKKITEDVLPTIKELLAQ
ncbi:PTS mannose transporter subunit IIA [Psittacicella hinzii]|uniref:PTS mannose transporter subunit IIA n=1 Tax=Psittacicella hinzii TaxID=2028575 RepID=A0A3A1Y655_9GAMM|nr:PTS sugar transporter subunit IIB [Psittacicella hinzii]RIY32766.1 PTS mannose transporter subunit IIA [Psittacicella hinzii]